MFYGYGKTVSLHKEKYGDPFTDVPASADAIITSLKTKYSLESWIELKQEAWERILDWYKA